MEPTEPKIPSEAIELYNDFVHGEISRRAFMEGVQRLAGGLAATTVINALMPNYALGQQVSRTDDRIKALRYLMAKKHESKWNIEEPLIPTF